MNKNIVQLIRERFYPLVRFCGPQSAGVRGTVYLGELSIWLWPAKSSHNGVLSDDQLSDVVSPHFAGSQSALLGAQVDAMSVVSLGQNLKRADGDTVSLLRYYLEDSLQSRVDVQDLERGSSERSFCFCPVQVQRFAGLLLRHRETPPQPRYDSSAERRKLPP
jgi:hypothetical protein